MEIEIEKHPLEPFLPPKAKLLMLGSFPPQRKRWSMDFYYPNLNNDMWRIVGLLFFGDKDHFLNDTRKAFCREQIIDFLNEKGIGVGTFYPIPLHLQPAFSSLGYHKGDLPQAEEAAQETVCLPIFPELEEKEIQYIIDTVNGFFQKK